MMARVARTANWLRIFCAALLLSLGFGHEPIYAAPSANPASSYYLLPDGTFATLCIGDAYHGKPRKTWLGSSCDACRLSSGILLPSPADGGAETLRDCGAVVFAVWAAHLGGAKPRPGSPVRGPPSLSI